MLMVLLEMNIPGLHQRYLIIIYVQMILLFQV